MPPTTVALAMPPPPGLAEATKNSLSAWQHHLAELFRTTKDRFPDVVWELTAEGDDEKIIDEVWGHKAIVYARAPPSFQSRYFSFRPHPVSSPTPYSQSPMGNPSQSAISLSPSAVASPSPRPASPSTLVPSTSLLRIPSSINPALFSNELEYLYTGQGFGEAFEFLFDSADAHDPDHEVDPEDLRIDKLRKDLVFMWRSRLYSDVHISLSGNFSSTSQEDTTAIFSSHRFILVSRSPYFYDALLSWPLKPSNDEIPTLTLPSPPFTPPSLHFTLGFIYTGTLVFSHRTYDLSTAFAILKAALYLSLPSLQDEIQARIAHEMLHGLFHAFLPFQEYERLTQSKWGTGGCRCRQCARRAPRVLEFSLEEDVKNTHLERGARRALVGLFGEGWCTQEFASLNPKLRESLLKGVAKRTTPQNVFPLLFAAEHSLTKLSTIIDSWSDTVREMILNGRKLIDEIICKESEAAFSSEEWTEIMEADGSRFNDSERVEWAMAAVLRGVKESWAATLYQTLVSSILIKPHPTEPNAPFLSSTSQIRQQVEQTRLELSKWISKRWLQIRQEHGFDALEGWAIKELSDYMEVPIEDLLSPTPPTRTSPRNKRPGSSHPHTSRIDAESEAASSMRVTVLSRNLASRRGATSVRDSASIHSSASSIRSARSTFSTSSTASDSTIGRSSRADTVNTGMSPARRIVQATRARDAANAAAAVALTKERPDSKLTPATPSIDSQDTSPTPQPSLRLPPESGDSEDQKSDVESEVGVLLEDDNDDKVSIAASDAPTEPESPTVPSSTPAVKKKVITRASLSSVSSRSPGSPSPNSRNIKTTPAASIRSQTASTATRKSTVSVTSRQSQARSVATTNGGAGSRPVSRSSTRTSTASTLSRVSTARSSTATSTTTTSSISRPVSAVSTASSSAASSTNHNRMSTVTTESTGTYRTASSGLSTSPHQQRNRKSSSAASTTSVRTAGPPSPLPVSPSTSGSGSAGSTGPRVRKSSAASVNSVNSTANSSAYGTAKSSVSRTHQTPVPPVPAIDHTRLSPAMARAKSSTSVRSVRSTPSVKKTASTSTVGGSVPSVIRTSASVSGVTTVKQKSPKTSPASSTPASPAESKTPAFSYSPTEENKENDNLNTEGNDAEESELGDGEIKDTPSSITIKPGMLVESDMNASWEHKKSESTASTGSTATIRKKRSNETITTSDVVATSSTVTPSPRTSRSSRSSGGSSGENNHINKSRLLDKPQPPLPTVQPNIIEEQQLELPSLPNSDTAPRGATLEIGIPCIVSSKRKRFKAYARYIGEVQGEYGPWVGVEVPIPLGESWADRDLDSGWQGNQWNDGTWGGIRYFDVGNGTSGHRGGGGAEWDYLYDDRATRRRRIDGGSSVSTWTSKERGVGGLKREGDQLMMGVDRMKRVRSASPTVSDASGAESRGLFVRPQQVLYVVDAVEDL